MLDSSSGAGLLVHCHCASALLTDHFGDWCSFPEKAAPAASDFVLRSWGDSQRSSLICENIVILDFFLFPVQLAGSSVDFFHCVDQAAAHLRLRREKKKSRDPESGRLGMSGARGVVCADREVQHQRRNYRDSCFQGGASIPGELPTMGNTAKPMKRQLRKGSVQVRERRDSTRNNGSTLSTSVQDQ